MNLFTAISAAPAQSDQCLFQQFRLKVINVFWSLYFQYLSKQNNQTMTAILVRSGVNHFDSDLKGLCDEAVSEAC